jgi:hypothetical protein
MVEYSDGKFGKSWRRTELHILYISIPIYSITHNLLFPLCAKWLSLESLEIVGVHPLIRIVFDRFCGGVEMTSNRS